MTDTRKRGDGLMTPPANRTVYPRASHAGYVHAVVLALTERGVTASDIQVYANPTRTAVMDLTENDPVATMWSAAQWLRLSWHEHLGWALQVAWPTEGEPRAPLAFGITAVPPPAEVAVWVAMCLIHPEITAREDNQPIRTPDLEEVLRTYPAPSAG
jgi:hypothetical protein